MSRMSGRRPPSFFPNLAPRLIRRRSFNRLAASSSQLRSAWSKPSRRDQSSFTIGVLGSDGTDIPPNAETLIVSNRKPVHGVSRQRGLILATELSAGSGWPRDRLRIRHGAHLREQGAARPYPARPRGACDLSRARAR